MVPAEAHFFARFVFRNTTTFNEASIGVWYTIGGAYTPAADTIQDVANGLFLQIDNNMGAVLDVDHEFNRIELTWRDGTEQFDAISNEAPFVGVISPAGVMPEEVAVDVQRRTGRAGRQSRGRVFFPFVPSSFVVGSTLTSAAITAYQSAAVPLGTTAVISVGGGDNAELTPKHFDRKANVLRQIVGVRVMQEVASRRDRRFIKRNLPA